jgi:CheY-like chemotaxis protein
MNYYFDHKLEIIRYFKGINSMRNLNVLIIDDSVTFIDYLKDLLIQTKSKNITTDYVGNCMAALNQLKNKDYQLVLVDPHLPDASYKKVIAKIRNLSLNTTIIVLTKSSTEEEIETFEQFGVVMTILKSEINSFILKYVIQIIISFSDTQKDYLKCLKKQRRLEVTFEARTKLAQWMNEPFKQIINVLIVDDSKEKLKSLELILSDVDCHVLKAKNSQGALKKLKQHDNVALILMDVQMPKKDGLETAELIRENQEYKDLPIIFISEKEWNDTMIMKGYALGASDYLTTPYQPVVIKAKVNVFKNLYRYQQEKLIGHNDAATKVEIDRIIQGQHKIMIWAEEDKFLFNSITKSLRMRDKTMFKHLLLEYELLLGACINTDKKNIVELHHKVKILSECLGRQDVGSSDVVDIHFSTILKLTKGINVNQIIAYTIEGRLLVIELMGNLLEYYHQ